MAWMVASVREQHFERNRLSAQHPLPQRPLRAGLINEDDSDKSTVIT